MNTNAPAPSNLFVLSCFLSWCMSRLLASTPGSSKRDQRRRRPKRSKQATRPKLLYCEFASDVGNQRQEQQQLRASAKARPKRWLRHVHGNTRQQRPRTTDTSCTNYPATRGSMEDPCAQRRQRYAILSMELSSVTEHAVSRGIPLV